MSDMTLKADQERQGWTQSSDIAWAAGYVIVTILLVLLWANVPAWGPRVHRARVLRGRANWRKDPCARRLMQSLNPTGRNPDPP